MATYGFPVELVKFVNGEVAPPFWDGTPLFIQAPENWVGSQNSNLNLTAILTEYIYHGLSFFYVVFQTRSSSGTTIQYGWIPHHLVGDYLKNEWKEYKDLLEVPEAEAFDPLPGGFLDRSPQATRKGVYRHSTVIKRLREEVVGHCQQIIPELINNGDKANDEIAENDMLKHLSAKLKETTDSYFKDLQAKA
ncbi:hypothetical protein P171DRAFT_486001 [Karstenula rhodostoma CBS 690.94]|uniref:Uncharacterized protein n=1 Tax=Karstenula rhodostoma CBS 690.94 TaxID=1392251 RepID=A0A9P4PI98_9PLEO|nr:hypothetical protein P171DRAFT_486001 [Karstenula rhodostoma CBS 690.94]